MTRWRPRLVHLVLVPSYAQMEPWNCFQYPDSLLHCLMSSPEIFVREIKNLSFRPTTLLVKTVRTSISIGYHNQY